MAEAQPSVPRSGRPDNSAAVPAARGNFKVVVRYILPGFLLGAGTGVWVANSSKVLAEETPVLAAAAGADVALLALTLAAMAVVIVLLDGIFGELIEFYGVRRFFAPFVVLAVVSALAAIVSFAGALDDGTGPPKFQDALFGAAAWLTVWAIAGAVGLVLTLVFYADERAKLRRIRKKYAREAPPSGPQGPSSSVS